LNPLLLKTLFLAISVWIFPALWKETTPPYYCWKIWFCISYKTHSGSNNHRSISFM